MLRVIVLVVAVCVLNGCDRISSAFVPASERINQAFPVSDEATLSLNKLLASSAADDKATHAIQEQYGKLLNVRALTCTAAVSVGRLDSPADIRKKVPDSRCFGEQDAVLEEWLGVRRVATKLGMPPLVPMAELPASQPLPALSETVVSITTSSDSNVAVLRTARGAFTAVRLPDGKAIQSFASGDYQHTGHELSPNGRVFAVPMGAAGGMKFLDVESGATLWSASKYIRLLAWLPSLDALVMTQAAQGQASVLVDMLSGKAAPYAIAERRPTWTLAHPGSETRRLVGGHHSVALIEHAREADGSLAATQISNVQLLKPVTSSSPFLMAGGRKLVYVTTTDLAWADLQTGDQGFWETRALRGNGYAKLNDSQVYFAAAETGSAFKTVGRVIDIADSTIASDTRFQHNDGLVLPLTPRSGFLRRGQVATIGSVVETGPPEDLQRAIAAALLEVQLAKLKAANEGQEGSALRAGMPPASASPMLSQIPSNAEVAVIGVYESKGGMHGAAKVRSAGAIRVTVLPSSTPLVLVLTNYEPVRWVVQNGGRKISAVLLSGYHEADAFGVDGSPILKIGSTHAYKMGSPEYLKLKGDIARYVANPVRTFQGTYTGQDFSVGSF